MLCVEVDDFRDAVERLVADDVDATTTIDDVVTHFAALAGRREKNTYMVRKTVKRTSPNPLSKFPTMLYIRPCA